MSTDQIILTEDLGALSFVPEADWSGTTNFNWQGYDCRSASEAATVNVNIKTDEPSINTISEKIVCDYCDLSAPIDSTLNVTDINSPNLQGARVALFGDIDLKEIKYEQHRRE